MWDGNAGGKLYRHGHMLPCGASADLKFGSKNFSYFFLLETSTKAMEFCQIPYKDLRRSIVVSIADKTYSSACLRSSAPKTLLCHELKFEVNCLNKSFNQAAAG